MVEGLEGNWATAPDYAKKLIQMMRAIESTWVLPAVLIKETVPDGSKVTLVIGNDIKEVPAESFGGNWYIRVNDSVKVKIRDILGVIGYGVSWDAEKQYIAVG